MTSKPVSTAVLAAAFALSVLAAGCREGTVPTPPPGQAMLELRFESADAPELAEVRVGIAAAAAVTEDGNEIDLGVSREVDLIAIEGSSISLADRMIQADDFDGIELRFEPFGTVLVTPFSFPQELTVVQPDPFVAGAFSAEPGESARVTVVIDLDASLQQSPTGAWIMTPQLRLE